MSMIEYDEYKQKLLAQKPNLAAPAHGRVLRCL